jgi:hypothetical protein
MMNASIARMGLVFMALASLGGCSACGPKFPKDKPPQIQSVYIFPNQSAVTADWSESFKAVALSTDGVRFNPMHYDDEGYTILWEVEGVPPAGGSSATGPVNVAMGAKDTNPVEVMVTDQALKEFMLRVTVSYRKSQYRDSVVIKVMDPNLLTAQDRVLVKKTPGIAAVMLNGCELNGSAAAVSRTEKHWEIFEASLVTPLGKNYTEEHCYREAVFAIAAPFQRLILNDGTSGGQSPFVGGQGPNQLWTDALGDELDAAGDSLWLAPDTLGLYVYEFTKRSDIGSAIGDYLDIANEVYGRSRVGIAFEIHTLTHRPLPAAPHPDSICRASYVGGTNGLDVDIVSERLNLVVLLDALPTGAAGWTCPPFSSHPGRVLYLKLGAGGALAYSETLAHELGHALGHVDEYLGSGWEHLGGSSSPSPNSQPQEGFEKSNVMHPKVHDIPRDHFTVGQGFRMNVDPMSWYQKAPGILHRHPPRKCGLVEDYSDACPPLYRDVDELTVGSGPFKASSSSNGESGP